MDGWIAVKLTLARVYAVISLSQMALSYIAHMNINHNVVFIHSMLLSQLNSTRLYFPFLVFHCELRILPGTW